MEAMHMIQAAAFARDLRDTFERRPARRRASSADGGASPDSHLEILGCGIPSSRAISDCESPDARSLTMIVCTVSMTAIIRDRITQSMRTRIIRWRIFAP